jgi:hypothetical protein
MEIKDKRSHTKARNQTELTTEQTPEASKNTFPHKEKSKNKINKKIKKSTFNVLKERTSYLGFHIARQAMDPAQAWNRE